MGFNEEIVYRGLSLVAFRGAYKEVYVWLATSILFGCSRRQPLPRSGAGPHDPADRVRLRSGQRVLRYPPSHWKLAVLMVLHALWDFGSFTWAGAFAVTNIGPTDLAETTNWAGLLMAARLPLQAVLVIMCLIGAKKLFTTPVEMAD